MIDLVWTALECALYYTNNPDWGKATPVGGEEEDVWGSASTEMVFGSKTSWTFGFGSTNNIFGPRIDLNVDYSYLIKNIDKCFGKGYWAAGIVGATGYFSYNLGPETSISYGASDLFLQRKAHADQEFEIISSPGETTPKTIIVMNALCLTTMVALLLVARVNHFKGFLNSKNLDITEKINKGITEFVNVAQPRFLAILAKCERGFHAKKYLETMLAEIQGVPKTIKDLLKDGTNEITEDAAAVLNKLNWNKKFHADAKLTYDNIDAAAKGASKAINTGISFVGSVMDLFQDNRPNWSETNGHIGMRCHEYELVANGRWDKSLVANVANNDLPGTIKLKSQAHEFDTSGVSKQIKNESGIDLGSESIRLETKKDSTQISCLDLGNENVGINLSSLHGVIIRATDQNSNIHLLDNKVDVQCGDAAKGPSIKMDGKESRIVVSVGTEEVGCALAISDKLIGIGRFGPIQDKLFLPNIKLFRNKIELSAGISKISLTPLGINLKSGDTELALDPAKLNTISIIIEQQAQMQEKINAIIEMLQVSAISQDTIGIRKTN